MSDWMPGPGGQFRRGTPGIPVPPEGDDTIVIRVNGREYRMPRVAPVPVPRPAWRREAALAVLAVLITAAFVAVLVAAVILAR